MGTFLKIQSYSPLKGAKWSIISQIVMKIQESDIKSEGTFLILHNLFQLIIRLTLTQPLCWYHPITTPRDKASPIRWKANSSYLRGPVMRSQHRGWHARDEIDAPRMIRLWWDHGFEDDTQTYLASGRNCWCPWGFGNRRDDVAVLRAFVRKLGRA